MSGVLFSGVIASLALVLSLGAASPVSAAGLTPQQESLASDLDGKLISPCCWTQTIAVHDSEAAEQLKAQVRLLVAQGMGEDEVLDTIVAQYGEEILAAPRASGFNLLAYALPTLLIALGVVVIVLLALRWRGDRIEVLPVMVTAGERGASAEPNPLHSRLDEELSRFDS
ncbi:MAG: cytochrome c-type biogenesis protein CcmH [Actinobacteria bacterium]|nr:cytochrome c-type biogenesis protein CcmH [Actinomycetota bacterium]